MDSNLTIIIGNPLSDDDSESVSREASPCSESPRPVSVGSESPNENICSTANQMINNNNNNNIKNIGVGTKSCVGIGRVVRDAKVGVSRIKREREGIIFLLYRCRKFPSYYGH